LTKAETKLGDPDITRMIRQYERRKANELAFCCRKEASVIDENRSEDFTPPVSE